MKIENLTKYKNCINKKNQINISYINIMKIENLTNMIKKYKSRINKNSY